jgi:hypothetical protein
MEDKAGRMTTKRKIGLTWLQSLFAELFGLNRAVSLSIALLFSLVVLFAVYWFFYSAPPSTITMTAGPEDSVSEVNAEKYAKILARNGVKLNVLRSGGSVENLKRLADPFQRRRRICSGRRVRRTKTDKLVSLGSLAYQPLLIFTEALRPGPAFPERKQLAVGPEGSGTRTLALALLAANGIEPRRDPFLTWMRMMRKGAVGHDRRRVHDGRRLLPSDHAHAPAHRGSVFDFTQADGYTRRIAI